MTLATPARRVTLTPASSIEMVSTEWVWQSYLPLGELALLVGREGIAKSTAADTIAARLSRGLLPGIYHGQPKATIICAMEDSWARTIVPRLIAAGADLDRIFRVNVTSADGIATGLVLPEDNEELEEVIRKVDAGLVLLDPLLSRLAPRLDSHKDAEVRVALEPIVAIAHRTESAVWGIIHANKTSGRDTGDSIMGSRAFPAVARAVMWVVEDPRDPATKVLGLTKSNLGSLDVPGFTFQIVPASLGGDARGREVTTGQIVWGSSDTSPKSGRDTIDSLRAITTSVGKMKSAAQEAQEWLLVYLMAADRPVDSSTVKSDGAEAGHTDRNLQRAATEIGVTMANVAGEFPRRTTWSLAP
jgi:hypothetical protein